MKVASASERLNLLRKSGRVKKVIERVNSGLYRQLIFGDKLILQERNNV